MRLIRLLKFSVLFVAIGVVAIGYGLYVEAKLKGIYRREEEIARLDRERKNVFRSLEELRKQIDYYSKQYSLDRWVPFFSDPLTARIFLRRHIAGLLDHSHARAFSMEVSPGAKKRGGIYYLGAKARGRFRNYRDLVRLLMNLEREAPLCMVEGLECEKSGEEIEVSVKLTFAYRLKEEKGG